MNCLQVSSIFYVLFFAAQYAIMADEVLFNNTYYQMFGGNHLTILDQGKEVQLLIDQYTGSGFSSKNHFGSGYFALNMKMPKNNCTGITTTFYLTSVPVGKQILNHDELDFEFIGGNEMPYTLRTNVYASDQGGREQEFNLWFNPTQDFHSYKILWNQHQIAFFVDETPIRVFKNNTKIGVNYPSHYMHIEASIWNPIDWLGPVNWTQGPFTARYRGFAIDGCLYPSSNPQKCYSSAYYWNAKQFWNLRPDQEKKLRYVRKKYMVYDYCNDKTRHFPECPSNQHS